MGTFPFEPRKAYSESFSKFLSAEISFNIQSAISSGVIYIAWCKMLKNKNPAEQRTRKFQMRAARKTAIIATTCVLALGSFPGATCAKSSSKAPAKPQDPRVVATQYSNSAEAARKEGDLDKAIKLYLQAFSVRYKAYGYRDPKAVEISRTVADIYLEKKQYDQALHYLDWAMKALVREHGAGDYSQAPVLDQYARLYRAQEKYDRAVDKKRQAVQMMTRKDESNPAIFGKRLELAELLVLDGDPEAARKMVNSAELLAKDYEYSPKEEEKTKLAAVNKLIEETPQKKPEEKKPAVAASPAKGAAKPAGYGGNGGYNLNAVRIDNLDERTVADGPLEEERAMLLEFIAKSNRYGIGIKPYVAAFDRIEAMVEKGEDKGDIEEKINELSGTLKKQFYVKALMANPRYRVKHNKGPYTVKRGSTSKSKFGVNPYWEKYEVAPETPNAIEDKYDGTQITEGYLRQIEQEVVRKEMARMPGDMKYTNEGSEWTKRLSRQAQRKRINNWRNKEMNMDYR